MFSPWPINFATVLAAKLTPAAQPPMAVKLIKPLLFISPNALSVRCDPLDPPATEKQVLPTKGRGEW